MSGLSPGAAQASKMFGEGVGEVVLQWIQLPLKMPPEDNSVLHENRGPEYILVFF